MSRSRRPHAYLICGCPRSGTTWLHNALIRCGRFRGMQAEDAGSVSRSLWVTDENRYVHALLLRMSARKSGIASMVSRIGLSMVRGALQARYGEDQGVMLKSPYFCFFLDLVYRCGFGQSFVFVRRNVDSIAASIVTHENLRRQVSGDILSFSAMTAPQGDFESRWVPDPVRQEFVHRYSALSTFDRASYKALCFIAAFLALRKFIPAEAIFVLHYDSITDDAEHRRAFCDFIGLSGEQERTMIRSYVQSRQASNGLPQYDAGFRRLLLETEASLWAGSG